MTHRERLLCALNHKEPDRVPIDFGATMETTIHIQAYERLKKHVNVLPDRPTGTKLFTAQFAETDTEVQNLVDADVRGVQPNPPAGHPVGMEHDSSYEWFTDEFGITWRRSLDGGLYYDMWKHPLSSADESDMRAYPFPDPRASFRFEGLGEKISSLSENGACPVVFDNCLGNGIFQMCSHLMGYDHFLVAMALGERRAAYLMDKVLDMKMEFWDEALSRFGDQLDVVKELDDLGTQTALMISPEMYTNLIMPRLKKLTDFIKQKSPHLKILMHSCGSMSPLIPHLIEAGVDALNPVQYTAANMEPVKLKKEFGSQLTFWGGGMDTQGLMKNGSAQQVRDETRRMLDIFMPGGGYVFAQIHAIQPDIPVENMLAMWEAAGEFGIY